MTKTTLYIRTGAAAIAAAFALTSTSVLAQDAAPVADVPIASEPTPEPTEPTPVADPAPVAETSAAVTAKAAAKPKAVAKPAARPATATAAPAAPAVQAPVAETGVAPELTAAEPMIVDPVAVAQVEPTAEPISDGTSAQLAFGGALALLALAGAALGLSRRRKARRMVDEYDYEPVAAAPAPLATTTPEHVRPAFDWGQSNPPPVMAASHGKESFTERARRGPTPDNPSLSLKKRLKRATFFEQREREVAAGEATPIDRFAGLSQKAVEAVEAVEPPRATAPSYGRVFQPA